MKLTKTQSMHDAFILAENAVEQEQDFAIMKQRILSIRETKNEALLQNIKSIYEWYSVTEGIKIFACYEILPKLRRLQGTIHTYTYIHIHTYKYIHVNI